MNELSISDYSKGYSNIFIKPFENSPITIRTKEISELNLFSKIKLNLAEKLFGKKYVRLQNKENKILIKISDLTDKLGFSKKEVLKAEKENHLNDILVLGLEARKYHIEYSVIIHYKNQGNLESLRYLEYLSDSLHVSLSDLLEAKKNNCLQEFIADSQLIEQRCYETFNKLDHLHKENNGLFITKDYEDKIQTTMTDSELNSIKNVIRLAYKILAKHPTGSSEKINQVISVTKNYHILAKSSENSFSITGLFGQLLGHGAVGVAVRTVDLLEGNWTNGKTAVLKIPKLTDNNSKQIIQEQKLIQKIHGKSHILGIQKKLRVIKNVFKGESKHCHLGSLYQTDLFSIILNPKEQVKLKEEDKISFSYQL